MKASYFLVLLGMRGNLEGSLKRDSGLTTVLQKKPPNIYN